MTEIPEAPPGWSIERTAGVNEYKRTKRTASGPIQLRIREVGMKAERRYTAYHGSSYAGSFPDMTAAVYAVEHFKRKFK